MAAEPVSLPTTGELRAALEQAAGWIARYLDDVDSLPVLARVKPGEVAAALPEHPPAHGEPLEAIMADVDRIIVPGLTHWNHPGFMAYFGITGSPPGILGETIAAALNVNAMLWRTSPAATELEQVTMRWAAELLGLPAGWFGQITDTASSSTLWALAAAREAAGLDIRTRGMAARDDLPPLRVYTSREAHSSVEKACIVLGFGQDGLVRIPTDDEYRMRPDALREAVAADVAAGRRPIAAVPTVGTTSSTSIDPVADVADVCAEHGMWLHVDAAYGGAAAVVPELRGVLAGCERADSLVVNPHKWLLTPIDCSLLYTARPDDMRAAFSVVPEYLRTSEEDVVNLMDYGVALGRRFRSLKLWMVLRAYGADGLAAIVAGHVDLARRLEAAVRAEPGWELLAPVPFSTVCFRRRPEGVDDEAELRALNEAILDRVNASGRALVSHTDLGGRYALRVAIGNAATTAEHVDRAWDLLRSAA
ncbi:MAG TPA: pyridoxal-dependent decarboxylase [Gaiellales bacterium]|nr:pyridoxal-dependent decarboxylase [Gaiellales bacterium]